MEGRGGRGRARGGGGGGGDGGSAGRGDHGWRGRGRGRGQGRGQGQGRGRGQEQGQGRGQPAQSWSPSYPVQQSSSNPTGRQVQRWVSNPIQPPQTPATVEVESSTSSHHHAQGRGQGQGRGQPAQSRSPSYPIQQSSSNPTGRQVQRWVSNPVQPPPPPATGEVESSTSSHHHAHGGGQGGGQPPQLQSPSFPVHKPSSNPTGRPVQQWTRDSDQKPPPAVPATVESSAGPSHAVKETRDKLIPMRRPDKGGINSVRTVPIRVNHFPVRFNSGGVIMHYDVDVKPEASPKKGCLGRIPKSTLYMIREKLCSDDPSQFPALKIAYDGEKNIFSAVELPTGKFKVKFDEAEDMKVRSFIVTVTLVKKHEFQKLTDYFSGKLPYVPRDILQGMDVVMRENPTRCMISAGHSFYPHQFSREDELGYGIIASRGMQQSLKPTAQGPSLCLDFSVVPFLKPVPVLEFLKEYVDHFNVDDFNSFSSEAGGALLGLKVRVNHRRSSQKYTVVDLTKQATQDLSFCVEDPEGKDPPKEVKLVDYFKEKYGRDIKYKHIPCLDVGKNNRKNYVPMEFCTLAEGQRYPKENLDRYGADRLKQQSLPPPAVRENKICALVRANDGACGGGIINNFGIDVNKNMTAVSGRVIEPPALKLGGSSRISVDRDKCHWNLVGKWVVEGIPVDRWAMVDFTSKDRRNRLDPDRFIPQFIQRCAKLGIRMEEPLFYESANMHAFSNFVVLRRLLDEVWKKSKGQLQILVCVMTDKHPGYSYLKWYSETVIGMVTQCCLSKHANKLSDQYLANLALKLNAKLGGSNVELIERLPRFEGEGHVMFIGADVNHPGARNTSSPSIAAVVATMNWPAANRYAARICPQAHRTEKIQNLGAMCLELVENYARANKVKPDKIVVFRDGVSEGQFDMVLNEELLDIKSAIQRGGYCPTITLIVARKRHLTRLFPEARDRNFNGNVPPGTVVDTTVVHLSEFDFYLCSHYGLLGTSKPTHYHVLYDEHKFTSDQIQKLTYNLCFTFARCTKPVSLVPPVYYADLAAYRGRLYYDAMTAEAFGPAASSAASSSLLPSFGAWLDEKSYRPRGSAENLMFFV